MKVYPGALAEQATNKQTQRVVNATILIVTTLKERERISSSFDEVRQQFQTSGSEGPE